MVGTLKWLIKVSGVLCTCISFTVTLLKYTLRFSLHVARCRTFSGQTSFIAFITVSLWSHTCTVLHVKVSSISQVTSTPSHGTRLASVSTWSDSHVGNWRCEVPSTHNYMCNVASHIHYDTLMQCFMTARETALPSDRLDNPNRLNCNFSHLTLNNIMKIWILHLSTKRSNIAVLYVVNHCPCNTIRYTLPAAYSVNFAKTIPYEMVRTPWVEQSNKNIWKERKPRAQWNHLIVM